MTTKKAVVRTVGLIDNFVITPELIITRGGVEVSGEEQIEAIKELAEENAVPLLWSDDEDAPEQAKVIDPTLQGPVPVEIQEVK